MRHREKVQLRVYAYYYSEFDIMLQTDGGVLLYTASIDKGKVRLQTRESGRICREDGGEKREHIA